MKSMLLLATTFAATLTAVTVRTAPTADPTPPPTGEVASPRIEAVFVLDTTGSMSGMIQAAKDRIWSIASTMAQADPAPELRIGLVAYRDRGDAYVTRRVPLSPDLDAVYSSLLALEAGGGGDTPESVNQALHEAVHEMPWSTDPGVYRVVFLVGDAPPHADYEQDVPWQTTVAEAMNLGIVVNTILCGNSNEAQLAWHEIASANQGRFLAVDADGGALRIDTPFDDRIAKLAEALDATRLWYGDATDREQRERQASEEADKRAAAPASTRASRGIYNTTAAGAASLSSRDDLVADLDRGEISLDALPEAELPERLRKLKPSERAVAVDEARQQRRALSDEIGALAREREAYLTAAKAERTDVDRSLDEQLLETVRLQARSAGLDLADDGE